MKVKWNVVDQLFSLIPVVMGTSILVWNVINPIDKLEAWHISVGIGVISIVTAWLVIRYELDKSNIYLKFDEIQDKIQSPTPATVLSLETAECYYSYLLHKARTCKKSWHDMGGFDPHLVNIPYFDVRKEYYKERDKAAARIQDFRYIGHFNDKDHLERIEKMILSSINSMSSIRFAEENNTISSKIEVTIVDCEDVIIGYYEPGEERQVYLSTYNQQVLYLFKQYYDDIWKTAADSVLKVGSNVNKEAIVSLKKQIETGTRVF